MNARLALMLAALSGAIAVGAGALGAHLLKERLSALQLEQFETAVRYQMYHALALFGVALLALRGRSKSLAVAGWCFVVGTLLFCGCLYGYIASGSQVKFLVHLVPLGGTAFILGWLALAGHACCGLKRD